MGQERYSEKAKALEMKALKRSFVVLRLSFVCLLYQGEHTDSISAVTPRKEATNVNSRYFLDLAEPHFEEPLTALKGQESQALKGMDKP
ncbi:MAG TPA: hypothetical protein ACFYD3_04630 [Candidatus Hypogeohydataceae bacterium YC41]